MGKSVHIPVMMVEALDCLALEEGMTVVDATLGGGGYTRALYGAVGTAGHVIALDADQRALTRFTENNSDIAEHVTLVHSNYAHVREILRERDIDTVHAIVADLGLSSDQIEATDRGFSFADDGALDMRLDTNTGKSVHELLSRISVEDLTKIIYRYGDEKHARRAAEAIVLHRPFVSTKVLAVTIEDAIGRFYRGTKIHPATRTFQALRIAVNDEYTNLETFLTAGMEILSPSGRMSIVSFHSGEDRIVKNVFRANARGCICPPEVPVCICSHEPAVRILLKKPLLPSDDEVKNNPRARSAKLRAVEKLPSSQKQNEDHLKGESRK